MHISLQNVSKTYDALDILNDLNITLDDVKRIAIIGPSGAGKSTLLRLLSYIESPDTGKIKMNQYDLSEIQADDYYKHIGFVFQEHNLFPHLSVLKNVTIILEKVYHFSKQEAINKALTLLKQFNLDEHSHKLPHQLSGGQSQRVSIVRSLALEPEIMFFDEPTSSLDPVLTQEVLNTIIKLTNVTDFIIVTHEILFAKKVADYIIFMEHGNIIEHGRPIILDSPKTPELKQFLSNVFMD